ncbi:m7GpppN-mRNA hydrolase-like [Dendronephthya gigantea]|uniref:m7GpppN-mRNA hydrolase-like n=1 Tax=Dendronephthya gigantea TaxID=151771 RepID=UPI0010698455|nr:m7GpppN-mRNA hydrolase-like [Dendronephthya gigantea]
MASKTERSIFVDPNVVHTSIPDAILEDLCSRFLINLPEEEQKDMVRVFFQIEQAHWYYIDFYCQEQLLPTYGLKEFTKIIFEKFPFLNKAGESIDKLMSIWKRYKFSVPVYGAILLNAEMDKCVLVQAYTSKSSWGFPRGKLNKDESPLECSIREVLEETGFNIKDYADPEQFLENSLHDHLVRLYIIPNVPIETEFKTRTRGEIKDIQWFSVYDLPLHKKDSRMKEKIGLAANNFFMVLPFVKDLKKWITEKRSLAAQKQQALYSQPQNQLQRMLQSENARLSKEHEQVENEKRKREAHRRFLNQMDFYHPLRMQEYQKTTKTVSGSPGRKQPKQPSEHDQKNANKSFKILQRTETDPRSEPGRRNSPVNARSPSLMTSSGIQESHPSSTRSLSPSSNSAFTRVSRANDTRRAKPKNKPVKSIISPMDILTFTAPAWANFRFDKSKVLEAFRT